MTELSRNSTTVLASGVCHERRLLADTSLAEDLVQEAFTNVWRGAGTFDSERGSFATWLYRITRNRAIDLDRKRRVRPSVTGVDLLDKVPGTLPHP